VRRLRLPKFQSTFQPGRPNPQKSRPILTLGQLPNGSGQLSDGSGRLSDDSGRLSDDSGRLSDDSGQLSEASGQLSFGKKQPPDFQNRLIYRQLRLWRDLRALIQPKRMPTGS